MDLTSGLNMSVVGIATVYVALTLLVGAVSLLARLMAARAAGAPPAAAVPGAAAGRAGSDRDTTLRHVALAAVAYHRHLAGRRLVPRPAPGTSSPWLQAGRIDATRRAPRG